MKQIIHKTADRQYLMKNMEKKIISLFDGLMPILFCEKHETDKHKLYQISYTCSALKQAMHRQCILRTSVSPQANAKSHLSHTANGGSSSLLDGNLTAENAFKKVYQVIFYLEDSCSQSNKDKRHVAKDVRY